LRFLRMISLPESPGCSMVLFLSPLYAASVNKKSLNSFFNASIALLLQCLSL